jgi:hypothetical protein
MQNAVFWDIKTHFVPHRRHITPPLVPSRLMLCKILGFHDGDCEECRLPESVLLRIVGRLLVTAKVVPSSPILVTLMMEALGSS